MDQFNLLDLYNDILNFIDDCVKKDVLKENIKIKKNQ
jgi:hypothetical protein